MEYGRCNQIRTGKHLEIDHPPAGERREKAGKMTKAYRIFKSTVSGCKRYIETWGYKKDIGFNHLITEEVVCIRTINAVQTELNRWVKRIDDLEKMNISDPEKTAMDRLIVEMVQVTINNNLRTEMNFKKFLNEM